MIDNPARMRSPVVIAKITEESKAKQLAYPRVFEARAGELWITTTWGDHLSMRLYEKDFDYPGE